MKRVYLSLLLSVAGIAASFAQVTVTASGGTLSANYTTLGAAFVAINAGTHTGAIAVTISANTAEAGPCVLNSSDAAPASYTSVSISPSADGVTVSGATATGRGLIELNGADNVTIDGDNAGTTGTNRNLTLTNTAAAATTFTSVIRLVTGGGVASADGNTIKNCIINGSATGLNGSGNTTGAVANTMGIYGGGGGAGATAAPAALAAVNTSGSTMNNLIIDNNLINICARGISINGSSATAINALTITNNVIGSSTALSGTVPFASPASTIYTVGITVQGITTLSITGNTIQNITSYAAQPVRGIEIVGSTTTATVQSNIINGIGQNTTTTGTLGTLNGIFFSGVTGACNIIGNTISNLQTAAGALANVPSAININNTANITGNKITKVYNMHTGTYGAFGIALNSGDNTVISNNFISDVNYSITGGSAFNSTLGVAGIRLGGGINHKVWNNTISLSGAFIGSNATNVGSGCLQIAATSVTGCDVRNNVFSNTMTAPTLPSAANAIIATCILLPGSPGVSMNLTLNNNAYYSSTVANVSSILHVGANTGTKFLAADFSSLSITPAANSRSLTSTLSAAGTNDNAAFALTTAAPFVSATDLHVPNGTSTPLESGGATVGVTTDIDGQTRPGPTGSVNGGATAPDMGADEFDGIPRDAVTPNVTYTALTATCSSGDRTFTATVIDNGGTVLTGGNIPRVYFRKGSSAYVSRPGVFVSGTGSSSVWNFTIVAADMGGLASAEQVSYFVVAQDGSANVGASPNTGIVATDVNTVTTPPSNPNIYFVQPVSGTFNVGVGQPYTTITAAVNAYNTNTCLTGPIVYKLTDANYPGETFPIAILNNALASSSVTLTIQPAAGVAASVTDLAGSSAVIKLLNARFVTIDGLNTGGSSLTLNNINTGTSANIWLASTVTAGPGCNTIALKNMTLNGGSNTTASDWGIIACVDGTTPGNNSTGPDNDNITITGNTFTKVGYAVLSSGTAITPAGGNDNWVVTNNTVGTPAYNTATNAGVNGMFFRNMTNLLVSGNTLQNVGISTSTAFGTAGLYFESNINRAVVTNNTVSNLSTSISAASGTTMGIYFGGNIINSIIARNIVTGVHNDNATTAGNVRGIEVLTDIAVSNDSIINNMVSDIYAFGSGTAANNPIGIDIENTGSNQTGSIAVWYNTVNFFGAHPGATGASGSYCMYIVSPGSNLDIRNNIFSNTYDNSSSTTDKSYAIYASASVTAAQFSNIDYNNYYVSGASNVLGSIGGTDRATLAAIQTGFGGNTHSVNTPPAFYSNTDLRLAVTATNLPLIGGVDIAAVTTDKFGTTRSGSTPVMGAHEAVITNVPPLMTLTPLSTTCSTGDQTLIATISDAFTGVPTTGTLVPRIYFRKDAGTWFSRPGLLVSGNGTSGTWNFTISSADMGGVSGNNVISYYIVSQSNAGYVGSNPFSTAFAATNVNTVTTPPPAPYSYAIQPGSGTFNVGVGQVYTTITQAVAAYNANICISGPIIFNLTDATYPNETFPITINNNTFASAFASLTIRPAAGVAATINSSTSAAAIFKLLNARFVTIDGMNTGGSSLTLVNNNTGANTANIWLSSTGAGAGCNTITLANMNIVGGNNTITGDWGIIAGGDGATPANNSTGNDNDNITVTGNTITKVGYAVLTSGSAITSSGANDNWVVSNNTVGTAAYNAATNAGVNGMFFRNMVNLRISGNTMQNIGITTNNTFGVAAFYLEAGINRAVVSGNTITNVSTSTPTSTGTSYGIFCGGNVINSMISGNTITGCHNDNTSGATMRAIALSTGVAASNDTIANNMISDIYSFGFGTGTPGNNAIGIDVEGSTGGVAVWHNSVNFGTPHTGLNAATTSYAAYVVTTGSNLDFRNNIFSNTYDNTSSTTDVNYAIYSNSAASQFSFNDFNDYFVSGSNVLARFATTDVPTLAAIQVASGSNMHSVVANPGFTSATNLHIPAATVSQLESGGANLGFATDFDGQVRPGPAGSVNGGATMPDIGADEFDGVKQDLTGPAIGYTALISSCGTGDRTLTAVISDASNVNTTAPLKPRVYYKKSTASVWSSQAGTLSSGNALNGNWTFTIVAADMGGIAVGDIVQYYIIAQDAATVPNVSATPGVGLVASNVNTVTTPPTTLNSYTVLPTLAGNYNIGTGQTYTTITAAVNAYNNSCLTGAVTFTLMDAAYSAETLPVTINANSFASATNTLTIKPDVGVSPVISGSSSAAIFVLNGADYVTIDGTNSATVNSLCPASSASRNVTINNTNTGTSSAVIWIQTTSGGDAATNNIIRNCNINGNGNTQTLFGIGSGGSSIGAASVGNGNNNNRIENNNIATTQIGIYTMGNSIVNKNQNNVINQNVMTGAAPNNLTNTGIFTGFENNITISGNRIANITNSGTIDIGGINLGFANNNMLVTTVAGNEVTNATVTNNIIDNIFQTGLRSTMGIGILGATSGTNTIANNMISRIGGNATPSDYVAGIYLGGNAGGTTNIYYNTITLSGTFTSGSTATDGIIIAGNNPIVNLKNNIFNVNITNGSALRRAISLAYGTYTNLSSDYNDFYTTGANFAMTGSVTAGTNQATFAAWQATTNQDAHSKNINPVFAGANDLHITPVAANVPLLDAGIPVTVANDIDCNTRNASTPDIGAVEFNIPSCNAISSGVATAVNPVICVSGITTINVLSATSALGMSYEWQSSTDSLSWAGIAGATNTSYIIPAAITATRYYRMISTCSFSGIKDSTTAKVRVNPLPTITVSPDGGAYCSGSSLTMAASGGVSYTWTPGSGLSSVTGAAVTTNTNSTTVYTVTGTDINGCSNTHVSTVTVTATPPQPSVTVAQPVLCNGQSTLLTASGSGPATAFADNFSAGTAAWTIDNTGTTNTGTIPQTQWTSRPDGFAYSSDVFHSPDNSLFVMTNADPGLSGSTTHSVLTSPSFSLVGYTAATLTYQHYLRSLNSADVVKSEISVDGGGAWTTLANYPGGTSVGSAGTFASASINLSAYLGQANVKIRFNYQSPWNWYWTLDNVSVAGTLVNNNITWTPGIGLYNDAALTSPYTGGVTTTVYAAPTAPTAQSINTYNAILTNSGCTNSRVVTVTVNPTPAANTGNHTVCLNSTTTLANTVSGGTWSTSSPNLSVVAATGVITGVAVGTGTVTYMLGTGCIRVSTITVNPLPAAITGNADACIGATNTLASATPGGIWSSSDNATATISPTGSLTGIAAGYATISYSLSTGCRATVVATVNVLPVASVSPATNATVCLGSSATFTAATSVVGVTLLNQDFNSGLGTWTTIDGPDGGATNFWQVVPSAPSIGVNGDGSQFVRAIADGNVVQTKLTSPSFSTLGYASAMLTFNHTMLSDAPDVTASVEYSINGGTWTLLDPVAAQFVNSVNNDGGTWTAGTPDVTLPLPAEAIGQGNVRLRWNYNGAAYWWAVDNIKVSAIPPAATYAWSGAAGLSCAACATTTITPTAQGLNNYSVTATTSHNCISTIPVTVSVNAMPSAISGTAVVCEQSTTTLSNELMGGTWTSSDPAIATVNASTGVVTGENFGTATITYTLNGGCSVTKVVTVHQTPAAITGNMVVCTGLTTPLTETVTGGTWVSEMPSTASVNSTGTVSGIYPGTVNVNYVMAVTGCKATTVISVNPTPVISGTSSVCEGATIVLTNSLSGGTWSISNSNAMIDPFGTVTGVTNGTVTITYTMSTGCLATADVLVKTTPAPITGTPMVCENYTTTLSDPTLIGVWTSSNTNATVNGIGAVSGITAGTATITYTLLNACYATQNVTVNMTPAPVTGTPTVCEGQTTMLSTTTVGVLWSSSNTAIAAVDASGIVTGVSAGTAGITCYIFSTGCYAMTHVTVNPTPAAITGATAVCEGLTTPFSTVSNGGAWSSSATANATVGTTGIVSGILAGNATITYTLPEGCITTKDVTVNPTPTAITSVGNIFKVCEGATLPVSSTPTGGTWSSSAPATATVDGSGNITGMLAGTTNITYTLPEGCTVSQTITVNPSPAATITGTPEVCENSTTTLANAVTGGTWSSSNTASATVNAATGVVTGVLDGQSSISYTMTGGCYATEIVTVHTTPTALAGVFQICKGESTPLTSAPASGTWTSSNSTVAMVDISGLVSGMESGTANITYSLGHGCKAVATMTVNMTPDPITGIAAVCEGQSTSLANAVTGGVWSSSNISIATVNATTGMVTGVAAGNANIMYTMPGNCGVQVTATVNPAPAAITGTLSICKNATTTLANTVAGGTWTSATPAVATVNATTGVVTGIDGGTAAVTYTLTGGCAANAVVTVNAVTPSVTVSQSVPVACNGTSVTYTATPANGGLTPTYTWRVNGTATTTTSNTFTYIPVNGDVVKTVLHSNATCAIPDSAVNTITMTVMPNVLPSITINAIPGNKVCKNTPVTFTSATTNAGASPILTWVVNGTGVSNAASYTYIPNNTDVVYCVLNSSIACSLDTEVYSNNKIMDVDSGLVPIVSIVVKGGTTVMPKSVVTFETEVLNGGAVPAYQWFLAGTAISGATNATFTYTIQNTKDSVTVQVKADGPCAFSTFNSVIVKTIPTGIEPVAQAQIDLRLVPNPNNGAFEVSGTLGYVADQEVTLEITDMLGQVVYTGRAMAKAGNINEKIKVSNTLANGMYMLNVRTADQNKVFHFVLKQ